MSDWPADRYHKPVISTLSIESLGIHAAAGSVSTPGSTAFPTANSAYFFPLVLAAPFLVRKVWWHNGSAVSGNVDAGVYTADPATPAKLFSCGSTVQAGPSVVQSVALGTPYLLTPGSYYLALAANSTSGSYVRQAANVGVLAQFGAGQAATSFPLPATVTMSNLISGYIPFMGITSGTVV